VTWAIYPQQSYWLDSGGRHFRLSKLRARRIQYWALQRVLLR